MYSLVPTFPAKGKRLAKALENNANSSIKLLSQMSENWSEKISWLTICPTRSCLLATSEQIKPFLHS